MNIERAWSELTVTKAVEDDDERIIEGTATTPTTDRVGDIVEPAGAKYKLPFPLLAHHDSRQPIGHVTAVEVTPKGIRIVARLAKNSGLDYVDAAWKQIKAGLVRGLSIGFRPLELEPIANSKTGGLRFKTWDWLELSAVTIPANARASIARIKTLDLAVTRRAEPGKGASGSSGKPPAPPSRSGAANMSTIAERIELAQNRLVALKDGYGDALGRLDDENPDETVQAEIDEFKGKIESAEKTLAQLQEAEGRLAKAVTVPARPITIDATPGRKGAGIAGDKPRPADLIFRLALLSFVSKMNNEPAVKTAADRYGDNRDLIEFLKAVTNPATTTNATWAAALVDSAIGDFLDLLHPISVYPQLAAIGGRVTFGRNGSIKIPYRQDTPRLSGAFVGEGAPIPVRRAAIVSQVLTPKKMAVISTFTRELAAASTPSIEALIRRFILDDTAAAIDTALLDALPGTTIRPPGLLNGVTPIPPAGGATWEDIIADFKALIAAVSGPAGTRSIVFIMNPMQALALSFVVNPLGQFVFPNITQQGGEVVGIRSIVSGNVPLGTVIALEAADFFTATGDTPEFDTSEVAAIHEDDGGYPASQAMDPGTVLPIVDAAGVVAKPVRSLWQTYSVGVRMVLPMDWAMVRPNKVAALTGVPW